MGEYQRARADLRESIGLDPQFPNAYKHLAWLQATCPEAELRDGAQAVANATRALELVDWKNGEWLETLAAAHAEAGNFDEAVKWQEKCLEQSPAEKQDEVRSRLELYRNQQPCRENSISGLPRSFNPEPAATASDGLAVGVGSK